MRRIYLLTLSAALAPNANAQAAAASQFDALAPVVATLLLLAVLVAIRAIYKFFRTPTLPKYLDKNPHLHTPNGIKCVHCGSNSIFLSFIFGHYGPKTHICRGCGRVLYRS